MKTVLKIMMLAATLALTACMQNPEEMLLGRWQSERTIGSVMEEGVGLVSRDTLVDYYSRVLEFMGDATCLVTDRDETALYQWSITGGNTLAMWREGWAEDYTLNVLTGQRLVFSDSYVYYDSINHAYFTYKYRFEYKRL